MTGGKADDGLLEKPDFRQRRFEARAGDADAHLAGGHGRFQPDEPAMADGREVRLTRRVLGRDPRRAVPRFNGKGLNSLAAMIHRFLQRNDVEGDRLSAASSVTVPLV